jgi:hypothetical protein
MPVCSSSNDGLSSALDRFDDENGDSTPERIHKRKIRKVNGGMAEGGLVEEEMARKGAPHVVRDGNSSK